MEITSTLIRKFKLIWLNSLLRSKRKMPNKLKLLLKLPERLLKRKLKELLLMPRLLLTLLMPRLRLNKMLPEPLLRPPERRLRRKLRLQEMLNMPPKWLLRMLLKKLNLMPLRLSIKLNST